jgi:hypothetical protein
MPSKAGSKFMRALIVTVTLVVASAPAFGQQSYSGLQTRAIKSLSDEQIVDLRAGRGMGLALAAEMNAYPGPSHAIELAEKIGLSSDQVRKLRGLFDAMKADAIPLGERLIEQEARLNDLFASKTANVDAIASATRDIGGTQAELRNSHLKYHLSTMTIMSPDQVKRYGQLRGYADGLGQLLQHHHRH